MPKAKKKDALLDDIGDDLNLTPKQEAFALEYFQSGNGAQAYRTAYDVDPNTTDNWIYVEVSQLLDHPKISLRLKRLNEQAAALSIYTRHKAMEELEEARQVALKEGQSGGAVSAVTAKVKLVGFDRPTRVEHTGANGSPIQVEEQTPLSLRADARAILAALNAAADSDAETGSE